MEATVYWVVRTVGGNGGSLYGEPFTSLQQALSSAERLNGGRLAFEQERQVNYSVKKQRILLEDL